MFLKAGFFTSYAVGRRREIMIDSGNLRVIKTGGNLKSRPRPLNHNSTASGSSVSSR